MSKEKHAVLHSNIFGTKYDTGDVPPLNVVELNKQRNQTPTRING